MLNGFNFPFNAFSWENINKLLPDVMAQLGDVLPRLGPRMDLIEDDERLVALVELPGLRDLSGVTIVLQQSTLRIAGDLGTYSGRGNVLRRERIQGHFERTIHLPVRVKKGSAVAAYKNGILRIEMEKEIEEDCGVRVNIFRE